MKTIKLNNWKFSRVRYESPHYFVVVANGEKAYLIGHARGTHEKLGVLEGDTVYTSSIRKAFGRIIETRSGTRYILGKIDPEYRKLLKRFAPEWNWRNPTRNVVFEACNSDGAECLLCEREHCPNE